MSRHARRAGRADAVVAVMGAALESRRVLRVLVVLAVLLAVFAVVMGVSAAARPLAACAPVTVPSGLARGPLPRADPVAITVDGIGACSSLSAVGVDAQRRIEVPSVHLPEQAAWYRYGPTPGQVGPAVIVGHVNGDGRDGVFADLADAEPGTHIAITRTDGRTAYFAVTGNIRAPKSDFPTRSVYGATAGPQLRLITCGGALNRVQHEYADNVIVFADFLGAR